MHPTSWEMNIPHASHIYSKPPVSLGGHCTDDTILIQCQSKDNRPPGSQQLSVNPMPLQHQYIVNPVSNWCKCKSKRAANPHHLGVNSLHIHSSSIVNRCQSSKSCANPMTIPGKSDVDLQTNIMGLPSQSIMHHFAANPLPVWCQFCANPISIKCQSIANLTNHMPI